jgi:hypothetical protein
MHENSKIKLTKICKKKKKEEHRGGVDERVIEGVNLIKVCSIA